MVDRVRCSACGAESFAGPNMHCAACFGRLKAVHDGLVAGLDKDLAPPLGASATRGTPLPPLTQDPDTTYPARPG